MVIWYRSWVEVGHEVTDDRLSGERVDLDDLPGHSLGVGEGRRDEIDVDAVDALLVEEHVEGGAELGAAGGCHDVDRVSQGRLGKLGFLEPRDRRPRRVSARPGPEATRTSVAMTAGPPVLVMIPTRFPSGIGWVAKAMAARAISPSSVNERMPVFSKISSVAISTPAREPVWDEAALAPCTVRPAFMASTGFFAATSRAASRNSCGSEKPFRVENDRLGPLILAVIADDLGYGDVAGVAVGSVEPLPIPGRPGPA